MFAARVTDFYNPRSTHFLVPPKPRVMNKFIRFTFLLASLITFSALVAGAQAPVANFSGTPLNSCSPIVVQFTDLTTNSPTSWSWNLGNGTSSTQQNPSTTYSTPGSYTVTMTATNASGSSTKTQTNYITILPAPTVVFVATDTSVGCGSKTVQFTNSSVFGAPGSGSYYWDFGDGTSSTATNPAHTYPSPGSYAVSLVVTNSAGCTKLLTKNPYITVVAQTLANFTATNNNSCNAPLTTSFSNASTGGVSYQWDFGDGGTSTLSSPSHTYTTSGSYTVKLITTGAGGCKDTMTKAAFVNIGLLNANFTQSATSTCTNNSVAFTNTTTPGTGGSVWYFGDGTTSTATNPTHGYAAAGTYTVTLIVNYANCADTATSTVTVAAGPSTSFTGTPLASCSAPLTTTFTNNTTGAVGYLWLFGDGTTSTSPNPSHTYNANGSYTVSLVSTSTNGCTDTMRKPAYVVVQPVTASITGNSFIGCAPASGAFTATATSPVPITSYAWSFGDGGTGTGASVTHSYALPGTYTLTLTVTAGSCTATATSLVVVGTKPTAGFTASPTTTCVNSPVTFTNTSSGATNLIWMYGDGGVGYNSNATHTYSYSASGTFSVMLVASNNGCTDTLVRTNYITVQPPSPNFTYSFNCNNRYTYSFTNTSIGATSYSWDFGDGSSPSTAVSPSHTFAANGTYIVTLTATNSTTGCVATKAYYIFIFPLTASFTATDTVICKGSGIGFNASSSIYYLSNEWSFGDGVNLTYTYPNIVTSFTHDYLTAGIYTVRLITKDFNGCADTMIRTNYINVRSPSVAFTNTPNSGCSALTVTFTDNSAASTGSAISNRTWRFGDGTSLSTTATTVTHTYSAAGTYSVRLVITELGGCKDSLTKTNLITVNKPVAQFTSPDAAACINGLVHFTNTSSSLNGAVTSNWTFGDGGTSSLTAPTHVYATAGNYTVSLIVTDVYGCKDTLSRSNYINVSPVQSGFTMSDSVAYCPPFTVNFTNTSTNAATYLWLFGNGSSSSLLNPSATYTAPGYYTAKLVAINANGCRDTSYHTIFVNTGPSGTLSYTPIAGCNPVTVTFTATSLNATSLTYDFDNGVTQTTSATTITYTYTQPGVYYPKLILSNAGGCSTYVVGADSIKVNKIYVGFTVAPSPACANTPVQFTDTSNAVTSAIATRSWNFGDGNTGTGATPTHSYSAGGTYTVRLIAATAGGCTDTAYRTVVINPAPLIAGSSPIICAGQSAALSVSGAATYNWSPATGLSCTNCSNPTANPPTTTTYTITGASSLGCIATGTLTLTVNPLPAVNAGPPQSICGGGSVTLTATGATSYSWSPSTGLSCTSCSSPTASPSATTTYTVTGTNGSTLCTSISNVTVTVTNNPTVTVVPSTGATICAGSSTVISASGATSYSWSPATGLSCTTCSNPIANPSATTTYTVTGTASGCSTSVPMTVTVTPTPIVAVSGPAAICAGASGTLSASGATTYSWSPATGLSCSNCASPVASPAATTTYTVTGTTAGCNGSASKTLTVNALPVVNAGSDAAICAGASTSLSASGASSYSWTPASGLSCANCANPAANPAVTTTYIVTGTVANGCSNTDTVVVTVNPLPVVSGGVNQFICPGGSVALNGNGAATYTWSPASGLSCTACASPVATPSATSTYKVVGFSALGCKDSANVTVTVNGTPTITVSGTTAVCAGGNTILTASGATSYSWTPATGLSCTSCANPTVTPTASTTYTITGTSGIGCTGTTTKTVTLNPLPPVNAGPDAAICAGASTTLAATGASTYSWTPSTGLSCTSCASPVASPTTTTSYTVTGTDANGCVKNDTVVVTVNPLPVVSGGPNQAICPGGNAVLNATGANSYVWSPAASLSCSTCASPTATPSATTAYKVVGTSALGCKDSATVTITVNTVPVVVVSGTNTVCAGGSTTLTASGASTYSWTPATGLSCTTCASPIANPAATITYTINGSSGVGCSASTTFTVTVNPLPVTNAGVDTALCIGGAVTLTATGASTYSWSPAAGLSCTSCASPVATPSATTTYVVTGTSAAGCIKNDTVIVTVKPLPTIFAGSNTSVCPGGSATLTATGGASYVWSPAATLSCTGCASPVATPTANTTYTVTGTGANGCVNTSTVTVSVNATPTVLVSGTNTICAGNSTTLTASGANTYSWTPATGLSCTSCASPVANPSSTITYTVTGSSGVGCTATANYTVTVNPLPNVNAGIDTAFCFGSSVTLTATGAATYSWSPAGGLSCTSCASPVASGAATTTYVVTGTSAAGCVKNDTVIVTVKALPAISAGSPTSICPGGSVALNATGGVSYVWSPATGLSCTTCASPTASPSSNTLYTVAGTGANGCVMNASVNVTINATPTVSIAGNNAICAGASTNLTASGAGTYSWTPATGLSCTTCANPTANPTGTTTYTITGTSGVGCTATTTFTLTVNPLPTVSGGANKTICTGASTTLAATGASTYSWSPATGLSCTACASPTANPTATTIYTVTGTSSTGCVGTANVTVTVNPLPTVAAGPNVSICPGGNTTLTASGAATYVWSPATGLSCTACASPVASPGANTTYTVTGTSAAGCTANATVTVTINATPAVNVSGLTAICAGGNTTLTATGANTYSWTPATGLSCTACASPVASPAATTTYTITGTSGVGCTATTTFTLTVNPLPVVNAGADVSICAGTSTSLTASGASSYSWTPAAGLSCTACAAPTASPTAATTSYVVTGTSAFGCVGTDTVVVTVKPLPIISAGSNTSICPGGSATLTPTGGVSYVWNAAPSLSCTACTSPVATPAATTTYTVTGTGANGCTATSTVTVTVNPLPVVTISGNTNVCAGSTTTLTASGANSYVWSPATGLSCTSCASPAVTLTGTTIYKVVGTSGLGCKDSASITVNLRPLPIVTVDTPTTVCLNVPVQLTAAGASFYNWAPTAGLSCTACSNPIATPASTTTYTVTGTDGYGCSATAQTTITVLPLPNVAAGPDVSICKGNSTQLSATGAASYMWSPATGLSCTSCNNPVASPVVTTAYVVSGTGANGCPNTDTVNVNLYTQPPVNAGPDQTICAGSEALLQASGAVSYVWTPGSTLSCTTCANPHANPMANTTYAVIGTDVHGCVDSDMVSITVIPHNPVAIGPGGDVCAGGSVKLSASGGDSYAWTPGGTLSCTNCATPTATPPANTTYTVIIRQGTCFADTLSVDVVIHPIPTINAGPDQSIILGNVAQINTTGTNIESYSWSPTEGLSCTSCANPASSPQKDMTYIVSVVSPFGCTAQDDITIHVRCDGSQVWTPNTFTPNADGQNDRFYPHGKGILQVDRFRIYDRWGELLFDRTNMPVNDKSMGWDGTYKSQPLKPDVYVWIMDATCTNGEHLQSKGDISLIR